MNEKWMPDYMQLSIRYEIKILNTKFNSEFNQLSHSKLESLVSSLIQYNAENICFQTNSLSDFTFLYFFLLIILNLYHFRRWWF